MAELTSWCRACDECCGILVNTASGRVAGIRGDPDHPVSRGRDCPAGRGQLCHLDHPERLVQVQHRVGGELQASSWELALPALESALASIIRSHGPGAVVLALGGAASRSTRTIRSLAGLRRRLGPVRVLSERACATLPLAQASRLVAGRPLRLRADLERAHHLLLLGAPHPPGSPHHVAQPRRPAAARHGVRGRSLTLADPRMAEGSGRGRAQLQLRPGTELYLLLGLLSATVRSGWGDRDHIQARCRGYDALVQAVAPWAPARVAEICGVEASEIAAEAMRFSRAPTAAVLASVQAFGTPWSTLTAWAMIALHAVNDKFSRPGGLYAHPGGLLAGPCLEERPTSELGAVLGRGAKALICLGMDPLGSLASSHDLSGLELLVCHDSRVTGTGKRSHWALPATHFLEEAALGPERPGSRQWLQWTSGMAVPPGSCMSHWQLLDALTGQLEGSEQRHARAEARAVRALSRKIGPQAKLEALVSPARTRTAEDQRAYDGGHVDRATWAVSHPDGRLDLAPEPILRALSRHQPPQRGARRPLLLFTSPHIEPQAGPTQDPGGPPRLLLHPEGGIAQGQRVRVSTAHGDCLAEVRLDPTLREDSVLLPSGQGHGGAALVDGTHLDRWSGTAWTDGQPCRVDPVASAAPKPRA